MQAQFPKPPFIGLWSRIENFEREDLRKLIAKRDVVRATMMRGTLHYVTRKDYAAWRPALQPALDAVVQGIISKGPPMDLDALQSEARKFYGKGAAVFDALREHLARRFPDWNERLMGYAVRLRVPLVMMPEDSAWSYPPNCEFALADELLGKRLASSATAHDLALRYLAAFGPASAADFQTWSGLKNGRAVFDELPLQTVGKNLFDLPDAPRPDEDTAAPVRFLPEYDNLLLAHADRKRIIADELRPRVATKNLRILPTFLVDGFVAGTWSITRKKTATLTIEPFAKLSASTREALAAEGERLVRFSEEDAKGWAVEIEV
jgi:hypothetical protein